MTTPSVLIVDDEETVHDILAIRLEGFEVLSAYSGFEALKVLDRRLIDVVILDLNLPGINGFEILDRIRQRAHPVAIVVLTGHAESRLAFEAGRRGARLFLEKSMSTYEQIVAWVKEAAGAAFPSTPVVMEQSPDWSARAVRLIESSQNDRVRKISHLVRSSATYRLALLASESGVDRGRWAHFIHSVSGRAPSACVTLDAAATSAQRLREQSLGPGGLCAGFSRAGGGTLFFENADKLPHTLQAELIEAVSGAHCDNVSIIFGADESTSRNPLSGPLDAVARSAVPLLHLRLPPLRERRDEIPGWVELMCGKHAVQARREPPIFGDEPLGVLAAYDWPENEAELDGVIARLVAKRGGEEVFLEHLPPECFVGALSAGTDDEPLYRRARKVFERYLVRTMLERHRGDRKAAAEALGVSHSTIKGKLRGSST